MTEKVFDLAVGDIVNIIGAEKCRVQGDPVTRANHPSPLFDGRDGGLSFLDTARFPDVAEAIARSGSTIIITNAEIAHVPKGKALIIVDRPRTAFVLSLNTIMGGPPAQGSIHPLAVVDHKADVHPSARIGPGCVIGECTIGENCLLEGNVTLATGVRLGSRVRIKAGSIIGNDGFSFERDDSMKLIRFPHFGGVVVRDDVEIGSNTVIDRGTFGDTVIGRGTKIDNLCHIAHNVDIGEDCLVIAHSVLSGSDKLGNRVWVSPGCLLMNGITIGDDAFIGIGAVVLTDVKAGEKVFGNPARPMLSKR